MPAISVDLPMTKHGYDIQADEVFWVMQGILRSTDLRDSMDEQCIADIAACIVGGQIIERAKDALDDVYSVGSAESNRISDALDVYGAERFSEEFKFCVDEILKVCTLNKPEKLRDIIWNKKKTTNAFPSVFATLLVAFPRVDREGRQQNFGLRQRSKGHNRSRGTDRNGPEGDVRRGASEERRCRKGPHRRRIREGRSEGRNLW
jgi:hypothetical protein